MASLEALTERNRQSAYSVILRDRYIDELETELDRLCLEFLARHQPVAGHLRFIFATILINREIERIGDYAESIARQVLVVSALEPQPPYAKFIELGDLSLHMMRDAVHPPTNVRLAAVQRLTEARRFTSVAAFEANLLGGRARRESFEETAIAHLDRLAMAVFVVAGQSSSEDVSEASRRQDAATSHWFADAAERFAASDSAPEAPRPASVAEARAALPGVDQASLRSAIEARALLQREIEHVAAIPA